MTTQSPLGKRLDMIYEQQIDHHRHRTSFLAKSFKMNRYQSAEGKQKQEPLRRISKTVNIFDKSNDQIASINQNISNVEEDQNSSRVIQFGGNQIKMYDMVGPLALRRKILKIDNKNSQQRLFIDTKVSLGTKINSNFHDTNLKTKLKLDAIEQTDKKNTKMQNMTGTMNQTGLNSTIQRSSILSKRARDEQNVYTKDNRQINRYNQYKHEWERQSSNVKNKSNSLSLSIKKPHSAVHDISQIGSSITQKYQCRPHSITLIDRAVKPMYIQPNRDRQDIINNNVTRYWEMSLRNNNKQLLQYMRGTNYDGTQFQELLQTSGGLKQVQKSIPTLDFRKRSEMAVHDGQKLSLAGKRKYEKQRQSMIASTNRRINEPVDEQIDLLTENTEQLGLKSVKKPINVESQKGISKQNTLSLFDSGIRKLAIAQQEVYKISYEGRKHWLGTQGL